MTSFTLKNGSNIFIAQDQKASGVEGGTFTSGAWQTRVLNTVIVNTIDGASLASNQITLPAGNYFIKAIAPAYAVLDHQTKIRNITAGTDLVLGSSTYADNSNSVQNISTILGYFSLSVSSVIELQHRCSSTRGTDGFGEATGATWGATVFSQIYIEKL